MLSFNSFGTCHFTGKLSTLFFPGSTCGQKSEQAATVDIFLDIYIFIDGVGMVLARPQGDRWDTFSVETVGVESAVNNDRFWIAAQLFDCGLSSSHRLAALRYFIRVITALNLKLNPAFFAPAAASFFSRVFKCLSVGGCNLP